MDFRHKLLDLFFYETTFINLKSLDYYLSHHVSEIPSGVLGTEVHRYGNTLDGGSSHPS